DRELEDKDSIFYHYQKLIRLRKELEIISSGDFQIILKDHEDLFAYVRNYKDEKLLVISNFYGRETIFKLPYELELHKYKSKILVSNYNDASKKFDNIKLRPYESIVYYLEK
ncbi:MAG: alpha-glucosidase C-terminal domain-containing protein, partial [Clostridia bacterium]|nr:alpha-glucosidase C-terminal domain-containing protein [Clostridia bacterium]